MKPLNKYDRIISENVNKYILQEKFRKGQHVVIDHEKEQKEDPTVTNNMLHLISSLFKGGFLNTKKFAEYVFPDHTPEGAQSQLRKALKGLNNEGDFDKEHAIRMTDDMAKRILTIVSQIMQI